MTRPAVGKPGFHGNFSQVARNVRVCELHFESDCFENKDKTRLKPESVPTVAVAKVTSVITAADRVQEVLLPPARLGPGTSVNAPLSALLLGVDSGIKAGSTAVSYEIPLIEQQLRVHRFALERLEKQVCLPVGVNAEGVMDKSNSAKEVRSKAEILSRRRRIQELHKELNLKNKVLREETRRAENARSGH